MVYAVTSFWATLGQNWSKMDILYDVTNKHIRQFWVKA